MFAVGVSGLISCT
jgi:hypothetical protein